MKKLFLCAAALVCALIATSCKNFLDAKNVKNEIEEAISYNNAKDLTIQIDAEEMGLISPNGSVTKKVGYVFEVQFKPDTENFMLKDPANILEAVNYYDRTINLDEYITYTPVEQSPEDKSYGLYRQKVKINKEVEGLYFRPKCWALPVIHSKSPEYATNGVYANQPIVVTFSMPMEAADTPAQESLFNFNNISITYKNQDITNCFENPVFNEDKTELTIVPKVNEMKAFMDELKLSLMDVQVSFSSNLSVNVDDTALSLKQNENSQFKVCYNPNVETNKPQKRDFYITRSVITPSNAATLADSEKFVQNLVANFSDDDVLRNRANAKIYIYGHYIDADSGVKEVIVTERRTNDMEDTMPVVEQSFEHIFKIGDIQFDSDDRGNTWFIIECPLESQDGAVLVEVAVKDYCENVSIKQSMSVINKTKVLCDSHYLRIENIPRQKITKDFYIDNLSFDYDYYMNNLKNIKIYTSDDYIENDPDRVYREGVKDILYGKKISTKDYKVYAEYLHKDGSIKTDLFSSDYERDPINFNYGNTPQNDYLTKGWALDLDVNSVKDLSFKIIIMDDIGARFEKTFTLPGDYKILYKYDSGLTIKIQDLSGTYSDWLPLVVYKESNKYKVMIGAIPSNISKCQIIPFKSADWILGDITEELACITQEQYQNNVPEQIEIKSAEWKKSAEKNRVTLKINLDDNWNTYDGFYVLVKNENNSITANYIERSFPASASIETDVSLSWAFVDSKLDLPDYNDENQNILIKIKGYRGNYESEYFLYPFAKYSILSAWIGGEEVINAMKDLDNYPPKVEYSNLSTPDTYKFKITDYGFTFSSAVLTLNNGKTFNITPSSVYAEVDKWDLDIIDGANMKIGTYTAKDAFETEYSGDVYLEATNKYAITNIEKNASGKYILSMDPSLSKPNMSNYPISISTLNETQQDLVWEDFTITDPNFYPVVVYSDHQEQEYDPRIYVNTTQDSSGWWICKATDARAITFPEDTFLYILEGSYSKDYRYFYTGAKSSGKYDYILTEVPEEAVFVSDAKVYVHTLYINRDYDVCSNWTATEWERYAERTGDQVLTFSSSDHIPQRYTFPSNIPDGAYYVAVFHVPNGTNTKAIKTKVYQK